MKHKSILALLSLTIFTVFFSSCKIETTNPATEVEFGNGELLVHLRANIDQTNDTNDLGYYMTTYEGIEGILVAASTNEANFYSNPNYSYNFKDHVVSGTTDANGKVTLELPVGERNNIQYLMTVGKAFVEQKYNQGNDVVTMERIAYWPSNYYTNMSKGKSDIATINMYIQ